MTPRAGSNTFCAPVEQVVHCVMRKSVEAMAPTAACRGRRPPRRAPLHLFLAAVISSAAAADLHFQSGENPAQLIELYTSEGCSSCPPAEAWLSKFTTNEGLWKAFVPVAYHVDYWDHLGWRDRFSSPQFTSRQRNYALTLRSESVYTPEVIWQGREWRDWLGAPLPAVEKKPAGVLSVSVSEENRVAIQYRPPVSRTGQSWQAHVALLGSGISSRVRAGENSGRQLEHDFVVLNDQTVPLKKDGETARAEVKLERFTGDGIPRKALAVWVSEAGKLAPVQATGGWLPAK
jgi:hypothetical protein